MKYLSSRPALISGFICILALLLYKSYYTPIQSISNPTGKILYKGNGTDPKSLDPQLTTGVSEAKIHLALFEGLVSLDPKTAEPIPGVATGWDIDATNTIYTFHLRPEACWSNGQPLIATDFVFAYNRILSPELAAEYASFLYVIKGAEDFHAGITTDFATVGIQAIDAHTLRIELTHPSTCFLTMLMHHSFAPVCKTAILNAGSMIARDSGWDHSGKHVSNGPFKLKSWNVGEHVIVEKNPLYWDAKRVQLDEIHFIPFTDEYAEQRAFEANQLHITETIPGSKVATLQGLQDTSVNIHPYLGTYYYALNTCRPPLNDVRVRTALNLAIDRDLLVEKVANANKLPAYYFTPPGISGYTSSTSLTFDPIRAQELLAEAGFPKGRGFPKLELVYATNDHNRDIALAIQSMWAKELNIHITLVNEDSKSCLDKRARKDFDIMRCSWIADYADPTSFLNLFKSNSTNNHTCWSHPTYDAHIEQAEHTISLSDRIHAFDQAEALLVQELPIIPIYFYTCSYRLSPKVTGWDANILDLHPYQYVDLVE